MTKTIKHDRPNKTARIPGIQDRDVLLGRGSGVAQHVGNALFRALIDEHRALYRQASKKEKGAISRRILSILEQEGSRFVEAFPQSESPKQVQYRLVSPERALVKVSQALRERKISSLRRDNIQEALWERIATNDGMIPRERCTRAFSKTHVRNDIHQPVVASKTKKKSIITAKSAAETQVASRSTSTPPKPQHTRKTRAATLHAERAKRIRSLYQNSGSALAANQTKNNASQIAGQWNSLALLKSFDSSSPFRNDPVVNPESTRMHTLEQKSTSPTTGHVTGDTTSIRAPFHGWSSPPLLNDCTNTNSFPIHLGNSSPRNGSVKDNGSSVYLTPNSRWAIQRPCRQNRLFTETIGFGNDNVDGTLVTPSVHLSPLMEVAAFESAFDFPRTYAVLPNGSPQKPNPTSLGTPISNPNSHSSIVPTLVEPTISAEHDACSNNDENQHNSIYSFQPERAQASNSSTEIVLENSSLPVALDRSTPAPPLEHDSWILGQREPSPMSQRREASPSPKAMFASLIHLNASKLRSPSPSKTPQSYTARPGTVSVAQAHPAQYSSPIDIGKMRPEFSSASDFRQTRPKPLGKGSSLQELNNLFAERTGLALEGSIADRPAPARSSGAPERSLPVCSNYVDDKICHLLRPSTQFEKTFSPFVGTILNATAASHAQPKSISNERLNPKKNPIVSKHSNEDGSYDAFISW